MNIFEGSRRIAKLIGACIAVGFLFVGITDRIDPVSISYLWSEDGKTATRIDQCAVTDKERTATKAKLADILKEKKSSNLAIGPITSRTTFKEETLSKTTSGRAVMVEHCIDILDIFSIQSYTSTSSVTKLSNEKRYDVKGFQLELILEAERRGVLPADKQALLTEARQALLTEVRTRGLVPKSKVMDVRLPDGTLIKNVPDDMSKADLTAKLKRNGFDLSTAKPIDPGATQGSARLKTYRINVTAPDGSIIPVDAPEGATAKDAIAFAASVWKPKSPLGTLGTTLSESSTTDDYARWIIANENKKGTPDFDKVAKAYEEAKLAESSAAHTTAYESPERPAFLEAFKIPESDESYITFLVSIQFIKNVGQHLLNMVGSLAGLWFFTWAVGWIVRGFLGIPRGSDLKLDK
jgi:hypothetical protein